jgi:hypothetical protein
MSIATYRGIKYDTAQPKQSYQDWLSNIKDIPMKAFTYRGKHYKPGHEAKEWSSKK